ncbi:MAG: phosphoenolpyruvate carboxykinase (ATP), partial [Bacteroidota bacterium]
MNEFGIKSKDASIADLGIRNVADAYWNLTPAELVEETIVCGEGMLTDTGALAVDTGKFTGRSPKDKFIVCDERTEDTVWWGDINIKFSPDKFEHLYKRITSYLQGKTVYVRDAYACADPTYRLNVRVVTESPWQSLFVNNLFLRPTHEEILSTAKADWNIICVPGFEADPATDGTRQSNFAVVNFTKQMILIGGTGYTGEIKKGIFSVLN